MGRLLPGVSGGGRNACARRRDVSFRARIAQARARQACRLHRKKHAVRNKARRGRRRLVRRGDDDGMRVKDCGRVVALEPEGSDLVPAGEVLGREREVLDVKELVCIELLLCEALLAALGEIARDLLEEVPVRPPHLPSFIAVVHLALDQRRSGGDVNHVSNPDQLADQFDQIQDELVMVLAVLSNVHRHPSLVRVAVAAHEPRHVLQPRLPRPLHNPPPGALLF